MWYQDYHAGLGLTVPIWITEIGAGPFCANYPQFGGWVEVRDNIMRPLQTWFEGPDNPGYVSMAWFISWWAGEVGAQWSCNFLVDARGTPAKLTPLGVQYVSNR